MLRPCSLRCIAKVRCHFGRTHIGVITFAQPKPLQHNVTTRYTVFCSLCLRPYANMTTNIHLAPSRQLFFPCHIARKATLLRTATLAVTTAMPLRHGSARAATSYVQGREHVDLARRLSNCKRVEFWLLFRDHMNMLRQG